MVGKRLQAKKDMKGPMDRFLQPVKKTPAGTASTNQAFAIQSPTPQSPILQAPVIQALKNPEHADENTRQETLAMIARLEALENEFQKEASGTNAVVKRQWITTESVRMLIKNMLLDAIDNGTLSWDVLIMECLGILLQSALVSKAGAIFRSHPYKGNECLYWRHIVIRMYNENGRKVLKATVTLEFEKGVKLSFKDSRLVDFSELDNSSDNYMCPIKLILIHALRMGAVPEKSWSELRSQVELRPGKTVVWTHPQRPVFCKMEGVSQKLFPNEPAGVDSAISALQKAARLSGIVTNVHPDDIHRGAAREIAYIKRARTDHSYTPIARGVTQTFVDPDIMPLGMSHLPESASTDLWTANLEPSIPKSAGLELQFASTPFGRARKKRLPSEFDEVCERKGADKGDKRVRMSTGHDSPRTDLANWRVAELEQPNKALFDPAVQLQAFQSEEADEEDNSFIDSDTLKLTEVAQGKRDVSVQDNLADVADEFGANNTLFGGSTKSILSAPPHEFVEFFSSINEYSVSQSSDGLPSCAQNGNSRNPATRKKFRCTVDPCEEEFNNMNDRNIHRQSCKVEDMHHHQFVCDHDGCKARCDTQAQLESHKRKHAWIPQTCTWPGCDNETVFRSRTEMRKHYSLEHHNLPRKCWVCGLETETPPCLKSHVRDMHPQISDAEVNEHLPIMKRQAHKKNAYKPQACCYPNCRELRVFSSRQHYVDHLRKIHIKGDEKLDDYIVDDPPPMRPSTPPRTRAKNYIPQRCSYPDCETRKRFQKRHQLALHLRKTHELNTDEEIRRFILAQPVD